jgi:ComF family protein
MHFAWEELGEIFFPPTCLACAEVLPAASFFCEDCVENLERLPPAHCVLCAEPGVFPGGRCPRCALRPPPFVRAFAPFAHDGPIARAIHQFKYEDHPELAPGLARLLISETDGMFSRALVVCAIPLHEARFRERKYDHAQLFASAVAQLSRRALAQALTRRRATRRQVGLSEAGRELNVAGAFRASREIEKKRVLLIDDVFTTGATARAAANALLEAGAQGVEVLTLARAFSPS